MRVTFPALGGINLLFGDQEWSAVHGLARWLGAGGGANVDRVAGGKRLFDRVVELFGCLVMLWHEFISPFYTSAPNASMFRAGPTLQSERCLRPEGLSAQASN